MNIVSLGLPSVPPTPALESVELGACLLSPSYPFMTINHSFNSFKRITVYHYPGSPSKHIHPLRIPIFSFDPTLSALFQGGPTGGSTRPIATCDWSWQELVIDEVIVLATRTLTPRYGTGSFC
ncbi:hypothetical protein PM082_005877 [Marasmius tenuissimus]|nr:hypothetical protein PM082_005877 [Marasmius tenuissimus]